jgi:HK97 family phage prohead protease
LKGEFKARFTFEKTAKEETAGFFGVVEGFASTPLIDRENDSISETALSKAASQLLKNDNVFFNHKHDQIPIGAVLKSEYVSGKGLYIQAGIDHQETWGAIERGRLKHFSVFGRFGEAEQVTKEVNGKDLNVRIIKDIDLWEVSVVSMPANPEAQILGFSRVVRKYLDSSSSPPVEDSPVETKVEKTMPEETQVAAAPPVDDKVAQLEKQISSITGMLMKVVEAQATQTKIIEKAKEAEPAPAVIQKTPTPALTEPTSQRRIEPASSNEVVFTHPRQYEAYEWTLLGKMLKDKTVKDIDLYATMEYSIPERHQDAIKMTYPGDK